MFNHKIEARILAGSKGLHEVDVCDFGNRQAGLDFLAQILPALQELERAVSSRKERADAR